MNIREIINKDIPAFTGVVVVESFIPLQTVRENGITLAWSFNATRAKKFEKILVAGGRKYKGLYFIADLDEIISVKELLNYHEYINSIELHNKTFNNWISDRQKGKINDDVLEKKKAIIFKNPTQIKKFSTNKFKFFTNPVIYVYGKIFGENNNYGETIHISNIGKVAEAKIKLNGLSVIAGVNNTGKSTVGKLLFSIVKAISRFEQDLNIDKFHNVRKKIEKLYFFIRRVSDISEKIDLREQFYPPSFRAQIYKLIDENNKNQTINIEKEINNILQYKYELINQLPEKIKIEARKLLDDIKYSILRKEAKNDQIKQALNKVLFSEFYLEVTPKGSNKNSKVEYFSGKNKILDFNITKNEITNIHLKDNLVFDDVIFIESPLLLQMFDIIRSAGILFETENLEIYRKSTPKLPLHIKDLIAKIEDAKYFSISFFERGIEQIALLKKISEVINGGYAFDGKSKDFIFLQKVGPKKSYKIKPTNTASGIKSFGIIQLLIQANVLDDRTLLVIDEPENHLHPEWQVKYAEIIVELIKNDIFVIISSHSPYMIQALKYFSEKEKLENKTSFYLAEFRENNFNAIIEDVTNDLNKVFSKLAKPLKELVWG